MIELGSGCQSHKLGAMEQNIDEGIGEKGSGIGDRESQIGDHIGERGGEGRGVQREGREDRSWGGKGWRGGGSGMEVHIGSAIHGGVGYV